MSNQFSSPQSHSTSAYYAHLSDPEQLASTVRRAVRRACPSCLLGQVEDIGQSVLTRLLARQRSAPSVVLTRGYVAQAARNAVIDELRAYRRQCDGREAYGTHLSETEGADPPDMDLHAGWLGRRLHQELAGLSASQREALTLYLTGHHLREIAERMDWSPKRADNVVFRTLGRLRTRLAHSVPRARVRSRPGLRAAARA